MDAPGMTTRVLLAALLALVGSAIVAAQESLAPNAPASGSISADGGQGWDFFAPRGAVVSLIASAESDTLDPILTLRIGGRVLLENDEMHGQGADEAGFEAITLPERGLYGVDITGFAGTEGPYTLALQRGYSEVVLHDDFGTNGAWQQAGTGDGNVEVSSADGMTEVTVQGVRQRIDLNRPEVLLPRTYYTHLAVPRIAGSGTIRLATRVLGDEYYAYEVRTDGVWRFVLVRGEQTTVLRDWMTHPLIVPGATSAALGILANGSDYDLFYDDEYLGTVNDTTLAATGSVGLAMSAADQIGARFSVALDDLTVTTPRIDIDGTRILPEQIIGIGSNLTVLELKRRQAAPPGGLLFVDRIRAFGQSANPGVTRFPLFSGTAMQDFILGATINNATNGDAGCGLALRTIDDRFTLVYADSAGGVGVSPSDGSAFQEDSFYALLGEAADEVAIVVVATGGELTLFANGDRMATVPIPATAGAFATSVVNFEAVNTECTVSDLWVWRYDE
jgi:hypothetical protein